VDFRTDVNTGAVGLVQLNSATFGNSRFLRRECIDRASPPRRRGHADAGIGEPPRSPPVLGAHLRPHSFCYHRRGEAIRHRGERGRFQTTTMTTIPVPVGNVPRIVATHLDCSVVRLGSRAVKLRVRIYSPDYPRVAGIKRSGVSPLAEPSYCRSLRSGPSDSRLSSGPIIFIRLSRIDWLCSANRA